MALPTGGPGRRGRFAILASVSRLFHTARHLRPEQLAWQLRYRLGGAFERPQAFAARPAGPMPEVRWTPPARFLPPGAQRQAAAQLRAGSFEFLGRREALGFPPAWDAPGLPHLWRYNLHYFEYLWALSFEEARELARDWTVRHPLSQRGVGWEPYPLSLRLQNWCAFFLSEQRERTLADPDFREALWASLALQADWLSRHLEFHLLGNHLLENAAALALCGACFGGARAAGWLRTGLRLLERELPEQVLADGGHFERSPMYQARVVYVLALLANSGNPALLRLVEAPLARAREALAWLRHPDGEIALLNDSAVGIANPPAELVGPVRRQGVFALPVTGYFGARTPEGHYIVCDAAPIGPDYLPGHAHGDIFSFELSLAGQRVVVDAGVFGYEADELRRLCRSTRAHSTLEIDGRDQCEFWAAFRVARRGRPRDVAFEELSEGFRLSGWHDGYRRLPGRPRHRRRFRWHPRGVLLVRDEVESDRSVETRSRIHLHPACELAEADERRAHIRHPGGSFTVVFAGEGELSVEPSTWCPEFGRRLAGRALVFAARGARPLTGYCLAVGSGAVGYDLASGAEVDGLRVPF